MLQRLCGPRPLCADRLRLVCALRLVRADGRRVSFETID
jgi:hypothetical protein